ncbi:hypothetical protein TNCT_530621 [Trichonephila clavata]|uniref:Uncharacterized protein n=1 Tax=Trichonephila clavata TaxID=2740835 RepID=A0A8X6HQQ8_TRICU|nr:hypothetical protein TNCT_530621 [Trichonephila clavata]
MISSNGKKYIHYESSAWFSYATKYIGEDKSSAKIVCRVKNLPITLQRFDENESELDKDLETGATVSAQIAAKDVRDIKRIF